MKKGLFILGVLLGAISLCGCDKQVETKVEYIDRIVEVEKPVEVIKEVEVTKEVPIEVEKTVYVDKEIIVEKTITVEVPVEKIVEVENIIEKEIPVEVEKIVTKTVTVEVPVEKVVEVEKIIEKPVYIEKEVIVEKEIYNDYPYLPMFTALANAIYCDDLDYHLYDSYNSQEVIPYLAVYKQGKTNTKNSVVECHSCGLSVNYMASAAYAIATGHNDTTYLKHTQLSCIKREDEIDYTQYLNKPIGSSGYYHGEYHYNDIYEPSETYQDTLSNELGLHILTNVRVECWSDKNAINYNNIPVIRYVLSYDEDYSFGEFYGGPLEEIRMSNRK